MEMEIGNQIRKYRAELGISQEELAEKIYVTRQTVSNWENAKSYPDIHSLLMMSALFGISLDQLIKGDIEKMKTEISSDNIKKFNRYGAIFTALFILMVVAIIPLVYFFGIYGIITEGVIVILALAFAFKVEQLKKEFDIQTYKEITAFCEGKTLDEISRQREIGKRPYQKILLTLASASLGLLVAAVFRLLIS